MADLRSSCHLSKTHWSVRLTLLDLKFAAQLSASLLRATSMTLFLARPPNLMYVTGGHVLVSLRLPPSAAVVYPLQHGLSTTTTGTPTRLRPSIRESASQIKGSNNQQLNGHTHSLFLPSAGGTYLTFTPAKPIIRWGLCWLSIIHGACSRFEFAMGDPKRDIGSESGRSSSFLRIPLHSIIPNKSSNLLPRR